MMPSNQWRRAPCGKGVLMRVGNFQEPKPRRLDPEEKKRRAAERKLRAEEERKLREEKLWRVSEKIQSVVGNVVPDGDPIDWLGPYVRRMYGPNANTKAILDKAARTHLGVKSYTEYLHDMWESYKEVGGDYGDGQSEENPWPL